MISIPHSAARCLPIAEAMCLPIGSAVADPMCLRMGTALADPTLEFTGLARLVFSRRKAGDDRGPRTSFSFFSRARYCLRAAARAFVFPRREFCRMSDLDVARRSGGTRWERRPTALALRSTAAVSVPGRPARPHPCVQERMNRHEKRNADQCFAAGGMPDRDH